MAVLLNRAYQGYAAGSVVSLPAETEAALVAQGLASVSAAALTAGAQSPAVSPVWPAMISGTAAVAAAASSVVISNPAITINSKGFAQISQAAADGTFTSIPRVSCAAGAMTITGNAAATAITNVSYLIVL